MIMHVLLAGATGTIGRRIIPMLLAKGHTVTALTRRRGSVATLRKMGATPHVVDVFDRSALTDALLRARPSAILHQLTDLSSGSSEANARMREVGTANLVDAAADVGVHRIIAQSIAWAYEPGDAPATEEVALDLNADQPRRTTIDGVVSLESTVRRLPEWVVLRYGLFYGPGTWFVPGGLKASDAMTGHLVADGAVSSFVHVDDAAMAAVQALGWPSSVVNVCDDDPARGHEWVPVFCSAVGAPVPPESSESRPGWARGASNARAREVMGWDPAYASWRQGFWG